MGKSQPPGLFYHQGDNDNVNPVKTYYDHYYLKQSGEEYENLTSGQTLPCECMIVVMVTMVKKNTLS